jgi:hypothetical protein
MTRRTVWTIVAGGIVLLVPLGLLFVRSIAREPSYAVTVTGRDGSIVLEWLACGGGEPVDAYVLSVVEDGKGDTQQACRLLPTHKALDDSPLRTGWEYGTVPAGYVLDGHCPPLVPGRRYRARVGGRIGGDVVFGLTRYGSVDVVSRSCDGQSWWQSYP